MTMKKIVFPVFFSLVLNSVFSQIDIGIQIAPSISINRVANDIKEFTLEADKANFSFTAGPVIDAYFTDNIAFSTGIWYANKKSTLISEGTNLAYSLQYVQVPITVKLFTNNISNNSRLYSQLGGTLDVKITEKALNDQTLELRKSRAFGKLYDAGLLISAGIETNIGTSNKLYAGISYHRGLVNVYTKDMRNHLKQLAKDTTPTDHSEIDSSQMAYKNDLISLIVGFKF